MPMTYVRALVSSVQKLFEEERPGWSLIPEVVKG
jgi:hypothetical protein